MKINATFVPCITFQLSLISLASALVEPEADTLTNVALASFVDTSALPPPESAFYQVSDHNVPASFVSSLSELENNLGLQAGTIKVDARSGKPVSLDMKHPILPGDGVGNNLLWGVGEGHGPPSTREEWNKIGVEAVKNWILDHQSDLKIDASNELFPSSSNLFDVTPPSLNSVRSAVHGDDGDTIQVSMRRTFKGVSVVGSRATATIKRGNLVNVGLERWGDINERFNVEPRLTEDDAYHAIAIKTGLVLTDDITCKPELQIITTDQGDLTSTSLRSSSQFGEGYAHRLVWRVCPKFEGQSIEEMEGIVDATTGEVLSFQDTIDYFEAKGDVFPFSNDGNDEPGSLQAGWPMPFMQVGSTVTDTGGNFALFGSQTAKLSGPYVEMRDLCGTGYTSPVVYGIAELTQTDGIGWGGTGSYSSQFGTDCDNPGFGTTANTHSSRSGFYELNKIIEIARSRLPDNGWLQSKLRSYMNINSACNAYWNGNVNFYRSSASCANTGELAGVFDHEWGHGMDANDVQGGIASPSGEGIADVYTALRLHDSCIGRGFFKNSNCWGNGNPCLSCTGVRDIDYMKRSNKSPSTYTWANNNCGGGVHCLGYVYSEAVWSLYQRELNSFYGYDDNTSLEIVTRLTYIAAGNIQTWYQGYTQSPSGIWRGGCGPNSGYLSYLAADDDNGDINDGTPHMSAIFKAFNDQEIACDTPTVQDSGCSGTPTDAPVVTVTEGNMKATLTWTAVTGASKYQVFRTEGLEGCAQGKVLVATLDSSIRTYTDQGLANNREYSYIVIPKGASESCFGPSSLCTSATPVDGPGIVLSCNNDPLFIPKLPGDTPATQNVDCTVRAVGGFTGAVTLGCDSSSLTGVTCAVVPSSVTASSTPTALVLSIQPTSSAEGMGSTTVTASDGSLSSFSTIPVTILTAGQPQTAVFDTGMGAPRCLVHGSECSSSDLLNGRGTITNGNEPNAPNTIDGCQDGNSGTYHADESIDKIVVRSGFVNGDGEGAVLQAGEQATIIATVYAWSSGSSDYADFYYSTDLNPSWTYITTKQPSGGGIQEIMVDYTLPEATVHRVRVNFRYTGSASACSSGSWDDHDDLVFAVHEATSPAPVTPSPVSSSPTKAPVTPKPTGSPTPKPTNKPTMQPTLKPTTSPTKKPTNAPTKKPTSSPTKAPVTPKPTASPTQKPTNFPTNSPTSPPSNAPTEPMPTSSPTKQPTNSPSTKPTSFPTSAPVTPAPTLPNHGPQDASFDSSFGAPRCASSGSSCSTGSLLNGRKTILNGQEPNEPNTLDSCQDGGSGSYHNDESIDKIVVRSGEINVPADADLTEGKSATIIASVYAWGSGASDTADFYYASDASSPNWQYIGSVTPPSGGLHDLKLSYTLPQGTNQAVRVQFRYQGGISSCTSGSYNDRDDVVFTVGTILNQPTQAPVETTSPTEVTGGGPQQASYDNSIGAPRCNVYGSECDSLGLLNGRGTVQLGNEPNRPNTLDSCVDGNSGWYHSDESIDKIIVRSGEVDGTGSGIDMIEGGRCTIIATIYPWLTGSSDYADFYYAADASNPQWIYLGTMQPAGTGLQELKMTYTLPQGTQQAVRVNFRYRGVQGANGACSSGAYDDNDDLAFGVKANPSFVTVEVQPVDGVETVKNVTVDAILRSELDASLVTRFSKAAKNAKSVSKLI